jgi:hypothetical protein
LLSTSGSVLTISTSTGSNDTGSATGSEHSELSDETGGISAESSGIEPNSSSSQESLEPTPDTSKPHISSEPLTIAPIGTLYRYQPSATGTTPISWGILLSPKGMQIDPSEGTLTWNPGNSDIGQYPVTIKASNAYGFDTQKFTLIVGKKPTITTLPASVATAGSSYRYEPQADGTNSTENPIRWSLIKGADRMTIDANNGLIRWDVPARLEGNVDVSLMAQNLFGDAKQSYTLLIGLAPSFLSEPPTEASARSEYSYQPEIEASAPVEWKLNEAPQGMQQNSTTGLITFTPKDSQIGQFPVSILCRNQFGQMEQKFTLNVSEALEPPQITSQPNLIGYKSQHYRYQPQASGTPPLSWSLISAPEGMQIDPGNGLITWIPPQSGVIHTVHLAVDNALGRADQEYQLSISSFEITSVIPDRGFDSGGQTVAILGSGFSNEIGIKIYFDNILAPKATFISAGELQAKTPAHNGQIGWVDVKVVFPSGREFRLAQGYLYHYCSLLTYDVSELRYADLTTFRGIEILDVNRDTTPDFATTVIDAQNVGGLALFTGNGDATFDFLSFTKTGVDPYPIGSLDVSGDGLLDLALLNQTSNTLKIFSGTNDGKLSETSSYATDQYPSGMTIQDFNNDGYPDIAIANLDAQTLQIWINSQNGLYKKFRSYSFSNWATAVESGYFNNDSNVDLALLFSDSGKVDILLGDGKGNFTEQKLYATGTNSSYLRAGDFNDDGKLDLAISNRGVTRLVADSITVLFGQGDGSFQTPPFTSTVANEPYGIEVGDFNGDGIDDFVVTHLAIKTVYLMIGRKDKKFDIGILAFSDFDFAGFLAIKAGDIDRDHDLDFLLSSIDKVVILRLGGSADNDSCKYK